MALNEFILLYQAGYIEENCEFKQIIGILTLFVTTSDLIIPILKHFHSQSDIDNIHTHNFSNFMELNNKILQFQSDYTVRSLADLFFSWLAYKHIAKYYVDIAHNYSCTHCDEDCLNPAIQLFEHYKMNPQAIKDEIERRKQNQSTIN